MPTLLRVQRPRHRYIPANTKHEQNLQLQVCEYLRLQYPEVIFRSDFASGLHLTIHQAALHKRLQSSRSFPDLFIYSPRRNFYGLAIELKKEGTTIVVSRGPKKGHLTEDAHIREQVAFLKELKRRGYYGTICCGFDEAKQTIDWYFSRSEKENVTLF